MRLATAYPVLSQTNQLAQPSYDHPQRIDRRFDYQSSNGWSDYHYRRLARSWDIELSNPEASTGASGFFYCFC
jgi:hypothetical protein